MVGVESRGFLLGAATAVSLGVGFVAVRKEGALFPGATLTTEADADYRGLRHRAARHLVQCAGATFLGAALLVDQLEPATRSELGRVTALATAADLGDPLG